MKYLYFISLVLLLLFVSVEVESQCTQESYPVRIYNNTNYVTSKSQVHTPSSHPPLSHSLVLPHYIISLIFLIPSLIPLIPLYLNTSILHSHSLSLSASLLLLLSFFPFHTHNYYRSSKLALCHRSMVPNLHGYCFKW